MAAPIESVVRTAATPSEAKVFVALLQAAGIPARVEGDALTDEYAASRVLLNLMGTRVVVPTASLAAAQEVLHQVAIDDDELARQALAEPLAVAPVPAPVVAAPTRGMPWLVLLIVAIVIAAAIVLTSD